MPKETPVKLSSTTSKQMIEFRDSGIHGMGGFALGRIRKGTPLIEYVGERITKG